MQAEALLELLDDELLLEDELLLLDEELLDDELELLLPLPLELPPHAARKAAAPPEASQLNIWRRWRICRPINSRSCRNPASWSWGVSAVIILAPCDPNRTHLVRGGPAPGNLYAAFTIGRDRNATQ
jgi:hypothetical protein